MPNNELLEGAVVLEELCKVGLAAAGVVFTINCYNKGDSSQSVRETLHITDSRAGCIIMTLFLCTCTFTHQPPTIIIVPLFLYRSLARMGSRFLIALNGILRLSLSLSLTSDRVC